MRLRLEHTMPQRCLGRTTLNSNCHHLYPIARGNNCTCEKVFKVHFVRSPSLRAYARPRKTTGSEDFDPGKQMKELSDLMPDPAKDDLFDTSASNDSFLDDDDFLNDFGDFSGTNFSNYGDYGDYNLGAYGSQYSAEPQYIPTPQEMKEMADMQFQLDYMWEGMRVAKTRDAEELAMEYHHYIAENCTNRYSMTHTLGTFLEEMALQDVMEGPNEDLLPGWVRSYFLMYEMFDIIDAKHKRRQELSEKENINALLDEYKDRREFNLEHDRDMNRFVAASMKPRTLRDSSPMMQRIVAQRRLEHQTAPLATAQSQATISADKDTPLDKYLSQIFPSDALSSSQGSSFVDDILGEPYGDDIDAIDVDADIK